MAGNVTTFASSKQFVGVALEATAGTPLAPTSTDLVTAFTPADKPTMLKDQSWRGSMTTDSFGQQQGVGTTDISISGAVFADGLLWKLRNILGDVSVTGTPTGTGATTLSADVNPGSSSITTAATIPVGTVVQIGTGATSECFTTGTPTGSGPYTIPLTVPSGGTVFKHLSADAVVPVTGSYTYVFSLLNSGGGQPPTNTLTHATGLTASTGARAYPGVCLSTLSLKWNAESELLTFDAQGTGWPSVPAATAPVANPGALLPGVSWRTKIGVGGPATGGTLVSCITDGELNLTRELTPYFGSAGVRTPYAITRGGLTTAGKLNFGAVGDEQALLYLINNTQPSLQFVNDNGGVGTGLIKIQVDIATAAFTGAAIDTSKAAVGFSDDFEAVATTTNAGGSGGFSPVKVSVTCNVAPGSF